MARGSDAIFGGMQPRPEPIIDIFRRRERDGAPVDDRRLRRLVESRQIVRVVPGVYVPGVEWRRLPPIDQHYVRVRETLDRARGSVVVSHFAAASLWGIDQIGAWPHSVDVVVPRTTGGRSSGGYRRRTSHAVPETMSWRGHEVTTPAQTALDLARISTFTAGVIALDQARWQRRRGGALVTLEQLRSLAASESHRIGARRRDIALGFSTGLSDSVRESEGRVLLRRLGFPPPVLQKRFLLHDGGTAESDYYFEEHDHACEFDGTGKYFDPDMRAGRTPEEVLLAEKDRADALQRVVRRFSRWRTPAHRDPRKLYDILTGAGLPSSLSRPPAGLKFS